MTCKRSGGAAPADARPGGLTWCTRTACGPGRSPRSRWRSSGRASTIRGPLWSSPCTTRRRGRRHRCGLPSARAHRRRVARTRCYAYRRTWKNACVPRAPAGSAAPWFRGSVSAETPAGTVSRKRSVRFPAGRPGSGPIVLAVGQAGQPEGVRHPARGGCPSGGICGRAAPGHRRSKAARGRTEEPGARLQVDARFAGHRDDVPVLLASAAGIFVLPSVWEGQPLILQEALRAGVPVVATRVGGTPALPARTPPGSSRPATWRGWPTRYARCSPTRCWPPGCARRPRTARTPCRRRRRRDRGAGRIRPGHPDQALIRPTGRWAQLRAIVRHRPSRIYRSCPGLPATPPVRCGICRGANLRRRASAAPGQRASPVAAVEGLAGQRSAAW